MDVINVRSTPSGSSLFSQISPDRQLFREDLEQRDVRCVMTGLS